VETGWNSIRGGCVASLRRGRSIEYLRHKPLVANKEFESKKFGLFGLLE